MCIIVSNLTIHFICWIKYFRRDGYTRLIKAIKIFLFFFRFWFLVYKSIRNYIMHCFVSFCDSASEIFQLKCLFRSARVRTHLCKVDVSAAAAVAAAVSFGYINTQTILRHGGQTTCVKYCCLSKKKNFFLRLFRH